MFFFSFSFSLRALNHDHEQTKILELKFHFVFSIISFLAFRFVCWNSAVVIMADDEVIIFPFFFIFERKIVFILL